MEKTARSDFERRMADRRARIEATLAVAEMVLRRALRVPDPSVR